MNLQPLASTQRFVQGGLLAASVLRLKDAPAIRRQAGSKDPNGNRLATARTPAPPV
jgi:hypothetical protein